MLGFAPYLHTWEERKAQNWSGALLSAYLAWELRTLLAKCASKAQAKCALKSAPDRLVRTTLTPNRTVGFNLRVDIVAMVLKKLYVDHY
jgi:hypothetical protein